MLIHLHLPAGCVYVCMPVCVCACLSAQGNIQKDALRVLTILPSRRREFRCFLFPVCAQIFCPWYVSSYDQNKNEAAIFTMQRRSLGCGASPVKPTGKRGVAEISEFTDHQDLLPFPEHCTMGQGLLPHVFNESCLCSWSTAVPVAGGGC